MDTDITIRRCLDYSVVFKIQSNSVLRECTLEDGAVAATPDLLNESWLVVRAKDEVLGAFRCEQVRVHTLRCHILLLPGIRKEYSRRIGEEFLSLVETSMPRIYKLYCTIPGLYQNVINYVESFGFVKEGQLTKAYLKNDTLHDLHYYCLSVNKGGSQCQKQQ